ncbi:MAG: hypothetical protein Q9193_002404 [Seirophora villosa]
MHGTHSLALLAALSTAVLSTPVNNRRQAQTSAPFVLRTDRLCGLRRETDPKFDDYLVNPTAPGGFSITFVKNTPEDLPRAAQAVADDQGVISFTIPAELGPAGTPSVRYLNLGSQQPPSGPQPYSLGEQPENPARLYLGGDPYLGLAIEEVIMDQELRLRGESVTPEWNTWAVCPGPELVWLGVSNVNVIVPTECEPLRLVAADPTDPSKTPRGC